jgi:hypothetical protein
MIPKKSIGARRAKRPILGLLKGKIWVADNFNAPLPEEILRAFYGMDTDEFCLPLREKSAREGKKRALIKKEPKARLRRAP